MNAADVVIITAILTSIAMVALLAVFVVKAIKHAAFRWRWVAIATLLLLLWISGQWSIGMLLLIISGVTDWGFGGAIIMLLGVGGFILVPLSVFAINKLTRPMNITWPVYLVPVFFVFPHIPQILWHILRGGH